MRLLNRQDTIKAVKKSKAVYVYSVALERHIKVFKTDVINQLNDMSDTHLVEIYDWEDGSIVLERDDS